MKKIDRVLKKLSELYDFGRKIKAYQIRTEADKPLKRDAAKSPSAR